MDAVKHGNHLLSQLAAEFASSRLSLDHILKTMQQSEFFSRYEDSDTAMFWAHYERVAKQTDEEFLERYNGDLDVQLIFAGLFSAVSSAFIVQMEQDLQSDPADTTNTLLAYLIQQSNNASVLPSVVMTSLQNAPGPDSLVIWTQSLAYLSLGLSLLAAFGAVLGKQWLGYFKTSRFGYGTRHERGIRRQHKLKGIDKWHLRHILDTLPILLQLSLLLFGISLAVSLFPSQRGIGGIIVALIVLGGVIYAATFILALTDQNSPFQNGLTVLCRSVLGRILMRLEPWFPLVNPTFMRCMVIFKNIARKTSVRRESPVSEKTQDIKLSSKPLSSILYFKPPVNIPEYPSQDFFNAILWLLETSTDTDALDASTEVIVNTTNWAIDPETARRAFITLRNICKTDLEVTTPNPKRAKKCIFFISGLLSRGLIQDEVVDHPNSTRVSVWLETSFNILKRTGIDVSSMESIWRITRIHPNKGYWPLNSLTPDTYMAAGPTYLLRKALVNELSRGPDITIHHYARIWAYILPRVPRTSQRPLILLNISAGLSWLLGLHPTLGINFSHCVPFCDEILLRLNSLFATPERNEKKDASMCLLYPAALLLSTTEGALQLYDDPSRWQKSIPTRLWLDLLKQRYHQTAVCAALRMLSSIVLAGNRNQPYSRLWTYHEFFRSTVRLDSAEQQLLYKFLSDLYAWTVTSLREPTNYHLNMGSGLDGMNSLSEEDLMEQENYFRNINSLRDTLIAMGMVEWSLPALEANSWCIKTIIFGLQNDQPVVRLSALYAAQAYRQNIHLITDTELARQLFSALLQGLGSVESLLSLNSEDDIEKTFSYYLELIWSLFGSRIPKTRLLQQAPAGALADAALYMEKKNSQFGIYFSNTVTLRLLGVVSMVNRTLYDPPESKETEAPSEFPLYTSLDQMQALWNFVSLWATEYTNHGHDAEAESFLAPPLQQILPAFFFYLIKVIKQTDLILRQPNPGSFGGTPEHVKDITDALIQHLDRSHENSDEIRRIHHALGLLDALQREIKHYQMEENR